MRGEGMRGEERREEAFLSSLWSWSDELLEHRSALQKHLGKQAVGRLERDVKVLLMTMEILNGASFPSVMTWRPLRLSKSNSVEFINLQSHLWRALTSRYSHPSFEKNSQLESSGTWLGDHRHDSANIDTDASIRNRKTHLDLAWRKKLPLRSLARSRREMIISLVQRM